MSRFGIFGLFLLTWPALAGCGGVSPDDLVITGPTDFISITGPQLACSSAYDPNPLTITVGTAVVWTNNDGTAPHTVTSSDGMGCTNGNAVVIRELDSPIIPLGVTFTYQFNTVGTFEYVCNVGGHQMRGTVEVIP